MKLFRTIASVYRLLSRAFGQYRWQIAGLSILSFLSSLLEGVGINSVVPLFSFVNKNTVPGTDLISHTIAQFFGFLHIEYRLRTLLLFIIFLFIVKAITLFFANYISMRIHAAYERNVRAAIFAATLTANWPYLSTQKVGYIDQVLITDVANSASVLTHISEAIILLTNLLVYTFIALNISVPIALLSLGIGLIVFLVFKPLFRRNKLFSGEMVTLNKELAHYANESVIGMKTIKSLGVERAVVARAMVIFERFKVLRSHLAFLRNSTTALLQPIGLIFLLAIFAFFYKTSQFNVASFAVIVYAINKVFSYIQLGQLQLHNLSSLIPFIGVTLETERVAKQHHEQSLGSRPFVFRQAVQLTDVQFAYNSNTPILRGITFSIQKGDLVGIIGPSGAGKTTIVDLLLRLFQPTNGKILLDGVDSADIDLGAWRSNIGYVAQEAFLMNDTVANNITFYDPTITKERMIEAARLANVDEFIGTLAKKYDTVIGERGTLLSGGQRQRIALARVLARAPQILILDEATSALDNESEALIQEAIVGLRGKVTVITIAHRLSTVLSFDRLLVVEEGKLVEEGEPQELLKNKDSYFYKVYTLAEHL